MQFMVIVKATKASEAGVMPDEQQLVSMMKFNEEMVKAGIMLDGAGLHPSARGAKVRFAGGTRTVVDGPFTEAKELVAGFWMLQCKSRDEVIEWVKRAPMLDGDELEIRQLFEMEEFTAASAETVALAAKLVEQTKRA
jgi:hypothetical protein